MEKPIGSHWITPQGRTYTIEWHDTKHGLTGIRFEDTQKTRAEFTFKLDNHEEVLS